MIENYLPRASRVLARGCVTEACAATARVKAIACFFVKIEAQRSKNGHINCNAGAQGKITGLPLVERFSHSPAYGE